MNSLELCRREIQFEDFLPFDEDEGIGVAATLRILEVELHANLVEERYVLHHDAIYLLELVV